MSRRPILFVCFVLFAQISSLVPTALADDGDASASAADTVTEIPNSDNTPTPRASNASVPTGTRAGRILDAFNKQEQTLLFERIPFSSDEEKTLFDKDKRMFNLEQALKRIDTAKKSLQSQKATVIRHRMTLQEALAQIDADIAANQKDIDAVKTRVANTNLSITAYLRKIQATQDRIETNKKSLLQYLSYIYSHGDLVYSDHDVDLIKTIIMNDGKISDTFNDIHYKTLLELTGKNYIEQYRRLIEEYYDSKESLKDEKTNLLRLKSQLLQHQQDIGDKRRFKAKILDITKGQESLYTAYINEKKGTEESVRTSMTRLSGEYETTFAQIGTKFNCPNVAEIIAHATSNTGSSLSSVKTSTGVTTETWSVGSGATDTGTVDPTLAEIIGGGASAMSASDQCAKVQKYYLAEKKLRDYERDNKILSDGAHLAWPVMPDRGISTYFHDPEYTALFGSEHQAIDIPTPQGTDITAPAAGYVLYVHEPQEGQYAYVALKHANGIITVYGHVSEILVQPFDFVAPGQVFARSGGAVGTPGAGVMTEGPHLHFEVYKDREAVDPLQYLDVTYIDFASLMDKYQTKYIDDLKARYHNTANVAKYKKFYIAGDTETDRQKYLLANYATADFQDWRMWIDESVAAKIDPSMTMCIGLAETGLGRNLKTPYNIGNVGNTDDGSTADFDGPRTGIYWIVHTLNNSYLGGYTTIDQLSRYGNKTGPIYASSTTNWQNNVVRCLSALKGTYVGDNYPFRIGVDKDLRDYGTNIPLPSTVPTTAPDMKKTGSGASTAVLGR